LLNERVPGGEQDLPSLLTCRQVLEMATIQGARDCHLDRKIGTLTPGKEADIVMLRMDTINVDTVFIAGNLVKRAGMLVGVDLPKILRAVDASRDGVLARAAAFGPADSGRDVRSSLHRSRLFDGLCITKTRRSRSTRMAFVENALTKRAFVIFVVLRAFVTRDR
jgi:adenine deaminase